MRMPMGDICPPPGTLLPQHVLRNVLTTKKCLGTIEYARSVMAHSDNVVNIIGPYAVSVCRKTFFICFFFFGLVRIPPDVRPYKCRIGLGDGHGRHGMLG